jgi:uncharacterized protein YndB with AHSA1/START domain
MSAQPRCLTNTRAGFAGLALLSLSALPALAEVVDISENGTTIRQTATINAAPARVYSAFVQPAQWWNPEHSFSGSAATLTLDAIAGGCFCEVLSGGGSVQHMLVVMAAPDKEIVMRGAMGPLQKLGVDGALTFSVALAGNGTTVTLTYAIGGYVPGGFAEWSKAVDAMLAETVSRVKQYAETGSVGTGQ